MSKGKGILNAVRQQQNLGDYRKKHWEGSFDEYLDIVAEHPEVCRSAYQRLYDMILSHGTEDIFENKEKITRFKFFTEFAAKHGDAIYGLDRPLMHLVNTFKSAAKGYGTERRVILLHGPVGSSKSTIARLLKKGMEEYSKTQEGAIYTFAWALDRKRDDGTSVHEIMPCPMNEDPLLLIPADWRPRVFADICPPESGFRIPTMGELCPACRYVFKEKMQEYNGDFAKVISHIKVHRLILSEKDRVGIGTFQPKDEKNQDSTELTGD